MAAREYKLSWVEKEQRWRKMYKGHRLSFSGEGGKKASYTAAKQEFDRRKAEIDAKLQPEYQRAKLLETLEGLRIQIPANCHDGHAARSLYEAIERLELEVKDRFASGKLEPTAIAELADQRMRGLTQTYSPIVKGTTARICELPSQEELDQLEEDRRAAKIDSPEQQARAMAGLDPLPAPAACEVVHVEVFPHSSDAPSGPPPWAEKPKAEISTLQDLLNAFVASKVARAQAGQISKGRVGTARIHAEAFVEWAGRRKPVSSLTSNLFSNYQTHVLKLMVAQESDKKAPLSSYTARDRLAEARSLAMFAVDIEAIASIPKCLGTKKGYSVAVEIKDPETISREEIKKLLDHATDRQRLYLLLGLNCGCNGADISDMKRQEIDLNKGTITRKRSKTKRHKTTPTVTYKLWPETIDVCKRFLESSGDLAFRAENGSQLITKTLAANGRFAKADSIDSSWDRLRTKSSVSVPHKRLRSTGASWLNQQERFARFKQLYLAHVPETVADRHYAASDLVGFHEALDAMRAALIT